MDKIPMIIIDGFTREVKSEGWWIVLLWVITFGKKGGTHINRTIPCKFYQTTPDPRCRCMSTLINEDAKDGI